MRVGVIYLLFNSQAATSEMNFLFTLNVIIYSADEEGDKGMEDDDDKDKVANS